MQRPSRTDEGIEEPAISSVSGYAIDTDPDAGMVNESQGTGTFETIVLEGDGILQTEEFVAEDTVDSEIAAVAQRLAAIEMGHSGEAHRIAADDAVAQPDASEAAVTERHARRSTAPETSPQKRRLATAGSCWRRRLRSHPTLAHELAAPGQW
jgi:hypothetical protein